jgi:hypothetical protein
MRFTSPIWMAVSLAAATATLLPGQRGYGVHGSGGVVTQRPAIPSATGGRPYPYTGNYPPPLGLTPPAAAYTGIQPGAYSGHGAVPRAGYTGILPGAYNDGYGAHGRNSRYGYAGIAPGFFTTPYYYPFLDYASAPYNGGYFDASAAEASNAQASLLIENSLGEQIQRLSAELADLRAANANSNQPPAQSNDAVRATTNEVPAKPITVVLQGGQQFEVGSYAVMNGTLWDFSKTPARKIPLSSIDVAASTKATEESGAEFPSWSDPRTKR